MSATSSGTRRPASRKAWSRPSASRSLAAKTAVGRRSAASAGDLLADHAAGPCVHRRGLEGVEARAVAAGHGRPRRPRGGWRPARCRSGRRRSRAARWPPASRCSPASRPPSRSSTATEEKPGRRGQPVDEHDPGAPGPDGLEPARRRRRPGATSSPSRRCGLEEPQRPRLAVGVLRAVGEEDHAVVRVGDVLDAGGHVGEERVGDVEDQQAEHAAAPGRSWRAASLRTQPELLDHVEDPARGVGVDLVGVVEHVGDRARPTPRPAGRRPSGPSRASLVPPLDACQRD